MGHGPSCAPTAREITPKGESSRRGRNSEPQDHAGDHEELCSRCVTVDGSLTHGSGVRGDDGLRERGGADDRRAPVHRSESLEASSELLDEGVLVDLHALRDRLSRSMH